MYAKNQNVIHKSDLRIVILKMSTDDDSTVLFDSSENFDLYDIELVHMFSLCVKNDL